MAIRIPTKPGGRPLGKLDSRPRNVERGVDGKKSPLRLQRVRELFTQGKTHHQMQIILSKEWGVVPRTVRMYVSVIDKEFEEAGRASVPAMRAVAEQRLQEVHERFLAEGDNTNAMRAMESLLRVQGAYAPDRQEVAHVGIVGVSTVDPDKVKERVAQILGKLSYVSADPPSDVTPAELPAEDSEDPTDE